MAKRRNPKTTAFNFIVLLGEEGREVAGFIGYREATSYIVRNQLDDTATVWDVRRKLLCYWHNDPEERKAAEYWANKA